MTEPYLQHVLDTIESCDSGQSEEVREAYTRSIASDDPRHVLSIGEKTREGRTFSCSCGRHTEGSGVKMLAHVWHGRHLKHLGLSESVEAILREEEAVKYDETVPSIRWNDHTSGVQVDGNWYTIRTQEKLTLGGVVADYYLECREHFVGFSGVYPCSTFPTVEQAKAFAQKHQEQYHK